MNKSCKDKQIRSLFFGSLAAAAIILLAVSALWPDVQEILNNAENMSGLEFAVAGGKLLIAFAGLVYRRIGKEKPKVV